MCHRDTFCMWVHTSVLHAIIMMSKQHICFGLAPFTPLNSSPYLIHLCFCVIQEWFRAKNVCKPFFPPTMDKKMYSGNKLSAWQGHDSISVYTIYWIWCLSEPVWYLIMSVKGVLSLALHLQDQETESQDHAERDFHSSIMWNFRIPAFQYDYLAVCFSRVGCATQAISAPSPASQTC